MSLTWKLILGFLFALVLQVAQMVIVGHFTAKMQAASMQMSAALSANMSTHNCVDSVRLLRQRIVRDSTDEAALISTAVYRVYLEDVTKQSSDLASALSEVGGEAIAAVAKGVGAAMRELHALEAHVAGSAELRDGVSFFEDAVADLEQTLLRAQFEVVAIAEDGLRREREVHDLPERAGIAITLGGVVLMAVFVAWFSRQLVIPIARAHAALEIRVAERTEELATTVLELEGEILERQRAEAQKDELHLRLVDASRMAGMAELANGVLHNVGNVLNSVNTSAGLLQEHLSKSKADGLQRAVGLLREHEHDLADFLGNSKQGRQLPKYLDQLGDHLIKEREILVAEARDLSRLIEHMIEIVSRQQSYARVTGTMTVELISALAEDVLSLHALSLAQLDIRVETNFEKDLQCQVDRSRVMQILMNLIANGKQAMSSGGGGVLRVLATASGDDRVTLCIADNGGGIAPENLTKIFAHGFTTKKSGHGFGLHHSANAATEMGGRLWAESAGVGSGASFYLDLPRGSTATPGSTHSSTLAGTSS